MAFYSAHPRESGDPGVLAVSSGGPGNEKGLGPRFREDERVLGDMG